MHIIDEELKRAISGIEAEGMEVHDSEEFVKGLKAGVRHANTLIYLVLRSMQK